MTNHHPTGARPMRRRDFLRASALAAASTLTAPLIVPSSVLGKNAPSNRITLGVIGCGNQSTIDLPEWLKHDDCQVVAVCDVNRASFGYRTDKQFLGREPQRDFVDKGGFGEMLGNDVTPLGRAVEPIRRVLEAGRPGETYNVGGHNEKPNIEIVRGICALLDELRPDAAGPRADTIASGR